MTTTLLVKDGRVLVEGSADDNADLIAGTLLLDWIREGHVEVRFTDEVLARVNEGRRMGGSSEAT